MTTAEKLRKNGIAIEIEKLVPIAERFGVAEIAVFGSSIRDDVRPQSDIDLLVSFRHGSDHSLFDIMDLERELEQLFLRHVDVVEPDAVTNPVRRRSILNSKEQLYAAR